MIALKAHFDGKAFVPDEPVQLPVNQRVTITVDPIGPSPAKPRTDWRALIGIANPDGTQRPHDPGADEDALWEKGYLPGSTGERQANDRHHDSQ